MAATTTLHCEAKTKRYIRNIRQNADIPKYLYTKNKR